MTTQGMHVSIADFSELRHQIDEVYDGLERRNSDFKDLQVRDLKDMESSHDMTLYLQASLNGLQERVAGVDRALVSNKADFGEVPANLTEGMVG